MIKKIFSESLHSVRMHRGMSLGDLAKRTGVSKKNLRRYESGKNLPRAATVFRLAQSLDTDVASLLDMRRIFAHLKKETDRVVRQL